VQINEIVPIILLLIFIIGSFSVISSVSVLSNIYINNVMCQQSASIRSMVNGFFSGFMKWIIPDNFFTIVPLICSQNEIIIGPDSRTNPNTALANEIASCWEKFGSGTKDPLFPDETFLCSAIVFRSDDPDRYVDLMKVYSLLYFNKSLFETEFVRPEIFSGDEAESEEEAAKYDFEYNAFRFCSSGSNQVALNEYLIAHDMNIGEENYLTRTLQGTSSKELSDSSEAEITYTGFDELILRLIDLFPNTNFYYTIPACLSFKEAALNSWKINNLYLAAWSTSCKKNCINECKESAACKAGCISKCNDLIAKFSEKISEVTPASDAFNQGTIIYDGVFYIRFYDYTHWMVDDTSLESFTYPETENLVYPINPDLFLYDSSSVVDLVIKLGKPEKNHDYVIVAFEPDSSKYLYPDESSFVKIVAGGEHSCGLLSNGSALCWGRGARLGNGGSYSESLPVFVQGGYKFIDISSTEDHTCGVLEDGRAVCWGVGSGGVLGNGQSANSNSPVFVSGNHIFKQISAGHSHTCGVLNNGRAMCWGSCTPGQLGNSTYYYTQTFVNVPVYVEGNFNYSSISVGIYHTCGLLTNGSVACWGDPTYSPQNDPQTYPAYIQGACKVGYTNEENGEYYCEEYYPSTLNPSASIPRIISGNYNFSSISSGSNFHVGLLTNGSAMYWGQLYTNSYGFQTTLSPSFVSGTNVFKKIEAGSEHICGILVNDRVTCWGSNNDYRLGTGDGATINSPGTLIGDYKYSFISAGGEHSCGVLTNGSAACWGNGYYGRIGDGKTVNAKVPTLVKYP